MIVKKDCYCEGYLHEISNHYREGIKERKLLSGTEVKVIEVWNNMYGNYIKIDYNGLSYDILPQNLEIV